jgi:hypothetical protein
MYFKHAGFRIGTEDNWARSAHLVEILHYKAVGRGFDSQWRHWDSPVT